MGNKIYKHIIIVKILVIILLFAPLFLSQVNVTVPEGFERWTNDILKNAGIVTLPFGLLYKLDRFTNIVPLHYSNGSMADVFLTPIIFLLTCSMWCGIFYGLVLLIRKKSTAAPATGSEYWKKTFLSDLLISLVSFTFIFLLNKHDTDGDTGENYLLYMVVLGLTIFCSFLLGSMWWLAEKLWTGNRLFAIITASTAGVAALVVIFIAVQTVRRSDRHDYTSGEAVFLAASAVADTTAPDIVAYEAQAASDFPLGAPELREGAIYLLHEQLEIDSSAAKKRSASDLAVMWHAYVQPLYYEGEDEDPYSTLAYTENRGLEMIIRQCSWTGRDAARLRQSFDRYKKLLYEILPYNTYQRSSVHYYVDKLLLTYNALQTKENIAARLGKLYTQMAVITDYTASEDFIEEVKLVIDNMDQVDPSLNNNDLNARRMAVWLVSFWARRYNEGNQQTVYEILKEISDMYNGD
ncbi:hypothetical protein [Chitinophaga sp.]|uniref:hypothetical protein n=1 Tax=Chitinophaga sp. TaxID=1869181 RepID=UPI002C74E1E6|nr:hypothetical protein [Chitinophaga sp.]HWV64388.1 hypothetical protein [Chitinophaga sp.]